MKIKPPSEHEEQKAFVQWFRLKYKDVRIMAIPNGGHRHISVASKLKAEGVCSGVPDLFIPGWHLWVEMKASKGKLSPMQKDWIAYLESIGYDIIVAYGAEDAMNQIEAFLSKSDNI